MDNVIISILFAIIWELLIGDCVCVILNVISTPYIWNILSCMYRVSLNRILI